MTRTRTWFAASAMLLAFSAVPALATKPNPHADIECGFCHAETPRFGVDTRETVTFWLAEGDEPALCERCHGPEANFHPLGVEPGRERLGTQAPARLPLGKTEAVRGQVVCTTCHFLHAANADFALLRGFPGSDTPGTFLAWQELCRECHGAGLERRSPHTGDDRACAFCHSSKPQPGQVVTVTPQGRRLCGFCHGPMSGEHYAGATLPSQASECTGCHDPHLGKDHPARLRADYLARIGEQVTLDPHGRRTFCSACHRGGVGPELRSTDPVALCQRCHGSGKIAAMSHPLAKPSGGFKIPKGWPLTGGSLTCVTCHVPGHRDQRGLTNLLRLQSPDRTAICFACHSRGQWDGIDPHAEAAERTGCSSCHAREPVWGADNAATVTFIADVNIVCLSCHDQGAHPGGVNHTVTVREGVSPVVPPELPLAPGRRITCATCHNPHLDTPVGHRLRGSKDPVAFCSRCHSF